MDSKNQNKDEDVFHFIGYIPIDGRLYELDGLKSGPVDLGPVGANQNWVDVVRPIIEKRMLKYSEGEIHFNLMAIVSDRQMIYQKKIDELLNSPENAMDTDDKQNEIARLRSLIEDEIAKKKRYKVSCLSKVFNSVFSQRFPLLTCNRLFPLPQVENIRRKHNYLPFIVELLKMLAEQGQLMPLYEKAKQRAVEREAAQ